MACNLFAITISSPTIFFKALVDKGIAQGIEQSQLRIARKMIEAEMTDQEIAEMTELPRQKIAALRKKK